MTEFYLVKFWLFLTEYRYKTNQVHGVQQNNSDTLVAESTVCSKIVLLPQKKAQPKDQRQEFFFFLNTELYYFMKYSFVLQTENM